MTVFVTAAKLMVICTGIALIVAVVNYFTADRIAQNKWEKTRVSLSEFFSEDGTVFTTLSPTQYQDDVKGLYEAKAVDGSVLGYAVAVSPMGFKDVIEMLVAVDPALSVIGVDILSMSETSGIGTKVGAPAFLNQFVGRSGQISTSSTDGGIDAIAGATKSSIPVIEGVNTALDQVAGYLSVVGGESLDPQ